MPQRVMSQRLIRLAQLASTKNRPGLLPVSPATVWRWVREKRLPPPFKLGEATTVWNLDEVEAFLAKCAESEAA